MKEESERFAVLIDADNISSEYIKTIIEEVADQGLATYKRIYGDWTKPNLGPWKEVLLEYSITPIQQYGYTSGKNSTDFAMIIDAMDILYANKVDGFVLVSSDSDFTRLASRLRESGMKVIGMGKQQTPNAFVKACSEFKYLDKIKDEISEEEGKTVEKKKKTKKESDSLKQFKETIDKIIDASSNSEGWVPLSFIGNKLKSQYPDFDSRNFGYRKLTDFIRSLGYEVKEEIDKNNFQSPNGMLNYVRKRRKK